MSVTVRRIFAPNLMPERRYTISELLSIAEEQTEEAKRALEAGEPDAVERVQLWSDTLEVTTYERAWRAGFAERSPRECSVDLITHLSVSVITPEHGENQGAVAKREGRCPQNSQFGWFDSIPASPLF